ncbi:MAG: hypothetical protein EKK31_15020 [Hyphomicrobiales bacterium]|nr:MAG: hypothetical protein EKK31_15020 [Hyphomicrobiales bacterium]
MSEDSPAKESSLISDRKCGTCTLCCKVMGIEEIAKPQGVWCPECQIGRGCKIYEKRPAECQAFYCGYRSWPVLGEHWFPAKSKMVVVSELAGTRIAIHMDPGRAGAWREEPFFSEIKNWSKMAAAQMHQVVVCIGKQAIVIFPDREVDLGQVADDERIMSVETRTAGGLKLDAIKLKADDPRLAGKDVGKVHVV